MTREGSILVENFGSRKTVQFRLAAFIGTWKASQTEQPVLVYGWTMASEKTLRDAERALQEAGVMQIVYYMNGQAGFEQQHVLDEIRRHQALSE